MSSPARGRDGTTYADAKLKIYGNISHLGAMIPLTQRRWHFALKMRKNAVVLIIGDGSLCWRFSRSVGDSFGDETSACVDYRK